MNRGLTDLERQIIQYGNFRQQKRMEDAEEAFQKLRAALVAITAASENSAQLPLPKVIGPVTEMVQEIAGLCGGMEGTESNCEVVACVLNAAKRYVGGERA